MHNHEFLVIGDDENNPSGGNMKKILFLCLLFITVGLMYAQDRIQYVMQYHNEAFAYYTRLPTGQITERAQRFTTTANVNLLQAVRLYLYLPIGTYTGFTAKVYSATTAAYPMPNVLLGSVSVPASAYVATDDYTTIDLSSLNLSFRAGEEFFISYSVDGGSYAATSPWSTTNGLGILATGNVGSNRAVRLRRATLDVPYTWQTEINAWDLGISAVVDYEISHDAELTAVNFYGTYTLPVNTDMVYDATVRSTVNTTETNVPVRMQVFNAADNTLLFTDTQTIAALDTTAYNVVFNPYSYTVEGKFNVQIDVMLPGDEVTSNQSFMFEQQVIANYPATISYDDGSCEGAWTLTNSIGGGFVSYFTPPYLPYKISDVRFFLYGDTWPVPGGNEFRIIIYDDNGTGGGPGTELYNQVVNGIRGQLNIFDISAANIVLLDGSFFVGYMFTQVGTSSPGLGTDSNAPWADQNVTYQYIPPNLYLTGITGEDFMINATVAYPDPQNVAIVDNGNSKEISWSPINGIGSYTVKSGSDPMSITTLEATTLGTSWMDTSVGNDKKFYSIIATSDTPRGSAFHRAAPVIAAPAITNGNATLRYFEQANN